MALPKTELEIQLLQAILNGKISVVQDLLSHDSITKLKDARYLDYFLIVTALDKYKVAIAKLLIERGFRVHKKFRKTEFNETILHYAVKLEDTDLITILLARGASQDILTLNDEHKTPLHLAINKNQTSVIELFLAQLDMKTFDEKYFLQYTIQRHTIPVASQLIGNGFLLSNETKEHASFKTIDIMLSFCSVKNMKLDNYDVVAPAYIASICGNLEVIKKYAESGLPINISLELTAEALEYLSDYSGFTLLHFAVKHVKLKVVEYLLSVGANILVQTANGSSPLHIAFESKEIGIWKTWKDFHNNNSIIDLLLEANNKFYSNPINKHGLSHFHIACSRDQPKVVEHFLKLGAAINQSVNSECLFYKQFSPLHFAAKFRCKKTIEILLKNGADVKQGDHKKMTALHVAAIESCLETVSLLLQYGAEINSIDSQGNTPVHWAFENRSYKIIDLLLSVPNIANSNPKNSQGVSHFHIACTRNNVIAVKNFIENGILLDTCIPTQPDDKELSKSDSDSEEEFDPYYRDWGGYSPLHLAICHNKPDIVQLLFDKGAKVEMKNKKGCDPLHMACQYPCEMFTEFVENILNDQSSHGKTTQQFKQLSDVAMVDEKSGCKENFGGSIEKIDWLSNRLEHLKIIKSLFCNERDVNRIDNKGATPIFWSYWLTNDPIQKMQIILENNIGCSKSLSVQIVDSLFKEIQERRKLIIDHFIKLNANLDKCSKSGSMLHSIAMRTDEENVELMELFIRAGANINARNDEMWTPLHYAVHCKNKKLIRALLDNSADVDCADSQDNSTPLLLASRKPSKSSFDIIVLLADRGANVNARRSDGTTALHDLASLCTEENVKNALYKCGEEVFQLDTIVPAISALMRSGANVNSQDSKGLTPLHLACQNYNYRFVSLLLDYGADVSVEDNNGRSVCCYVCDICHGIRQRYELIDIVVQLIDKLKMHIVKMKTIGMTTSNKAMSSIDHHASLTSFSAEQQKFVVEYHAEIQAFKDMKIHDNCTLFDAMFKNENTLSRLVKNPTFKDIVIFKSFEKKYKHYGYLIKLKYKEGINRDDLLPKAKWVLKRLAGLELPDTCSENICKYFSNLELKESIQMLSVVLDFKI